ncbi:MAG: low molecular weight phosphatase family protein [Pseudomonadota bacterium]
MTTCILFACNQNSVRSPMAAALLRKDADASVQIDSAGVYEGGLDPFIELIMGEVGVDMQEHEPKSIDEVDLAAFDRVIALTPEAASAIRKASPEACVEFWEIENPSEERGGREAILEAYRSVRDELLKRLRGRFPELYEKP